MSLPINTTPDQSPNTVAQVNTQSEATSPAMQTNVASMSALLTGAANAASEALIAADNGTTPDEIQTPEADPLAAISSDAEKEGKSGGDGSSPHDHSEETHLTERHPEGSAPQKTLPPTNLSSGHNLQAAAEAQMAKNESVYSTGTPEQIAQEVTDLKTSLQENPGGVSSQTLATAESHLGIAAQLAAQLSNPSQQANSANLRTDIQSQVTSAYTAIISDLLTNPAQLTNVLLSNHSPDATMAITDTITKVQNGTYALPGGNIADIIAGKNVIPGAPPEPIATVSNQTLCNLLGAFAAAAQENLVMAAQYSSEGATDSANIASTAVADSTGQLKYVDQQVKQSENEQAKAEKKQKSNDIWNKIGVAFEVIAIAVAVAVIYCAAILGTALTGGALGPVAIMAAIATSSILIGLMADSIAATYDPKDPNPMTAAIGGVTDALVDAGMNKSAANILSTILVTALMLAMTFGTSAMGDAAEATTEAASSVAQTASDTFAAVSKAISNSITYLTSDSTDLLADFTATAQQVGSASMAAAINATSSITRAASTAAQSTSDTASSIATTVASAVTSPVETASTIGTAALSAAQSAGAAVLSAATDVVNSVGESLSSIATDSYKAVMGGVDATGAPLTAMDRLGAAGSALSKIDITGALKSLSSIGTDSYNAVMGGVDATGAPLTAMDRLGAAGNALTKIGALVELAGSIYQGTTEVELGKIQIAMAKNMANIGTTQGNIDLINNIITTQNQNSNTFMSSYQAIIQQLSNTDIQQAAGAGSTQADMLSQNMS